MTGGPTGGHEHTDAQPTRSPPRRRPFDAASSAGRPGQRGGLLTGTRYDLSAQPDGVYTFRVRAIDPAATPTDTTRLHARPQSARPRRRSPAARRRHADPNPAFAFTEEAGATTMPDRARGDRHQRLDDVLSPQGYGLGARARRRLHLPRPRHRRGRQHRRRRHPPLTLDRIAPVAPTMTAPAADTTTARRPGRSPATATDGFRCRLVRGATVVSTTPPAPARALRPLRSARRRVHVQGPGQRRGEQVTEAPTRSRSTAPPRPRPRSPPARPARRTRARRATSPPRPGRRRVPHRARRDRISDWSPA